MEDDLTEMMEDGDSQNMPFKPALIAKKCDQLAPRFGACMYDPYTSTTTINPTS